MGELEGLQEMNQALLMKMQEKEDEIRKWKKDAEDKDKLIADLKKEKENSDNSKQETLDALSKLQGELKEWQDKANEREGEMNKLKTELEEAGKKLKETTDALDAAKNAGNAANTQQPPAQAPAQPAGQPPQQGQPAAGAQPAAGGKQVTISVEELLKWDKNAKALASQNKKLEQEIADLKKDLEDKAVSLGRSQRKQDMAVEAFEERNKVLQQMLNDNLQKTNQLEAKCKNLEDANVNFRRDAQQRDEEITRLRETAREKFDWERKHAEALKIIEDYEAYKRETENARQSIGDTQREMFRLLEENESIRKQLTEYEERVESNEKTMAELREELRETRQKEEDARNEKMALYNKLTILEQEIGGLKKRRDSLETTLEDIEGQKNIQFKQLQLEIKELKSTLYKEREALKAVTDDKRRLESDAKLASIGGKPSGGGGLFSSGPSYAGEKEKGMVETLSKRISDLEEENRAYLEQVQKAEQQIKDKDVALIAVAEDLWGKGALAKELTDPQDLEDYKLLEAEHLEMDPVVVAEKTLIENLKLRRDLTNLGMVMNNMMREKK